MSRTPDDHVVVPHEYADGGIAEAPNDPPRSTRSELNQQGIRDSPDYANGKRPSRPCRTPENGNRECSIPAELTNRRHLDVRFFGDELCPGIAEHGRKRRICDAEAPCVGRNHGTQPSVARLAALGA
jgi:hypothetical protein